jgi:hypothetical protein
MGKRVSVEERIIKAVKAAVEERFAIHEKYKHPTNAAPTTAQKTIYDYINQQAAEDAMRPAVSMCDFCDVPKPPPNVKVRCYNHQVYPAGQCKNCANGTRDNLGPAPAPKHNVANVRIKQTFEHVNYALRKMRSISILLTETAFEIKINRGYARRFIFVNAYNGPDFFVDAKWNDANGQPRSHGYNTLGEACADITALAMYYAMC